MINLKEVAETLLQVANNQEQLKSIVDLMESSNNTVKDDISKLREGAKSEPKFDLDKMLDAAEQICVDISDAGNNLSQAENAISEAIGCIDEADYDATQLHDMLESVKHELTNEKDDVKNEEDE